MERNMLLGGCLVQHGRETCTNGSVMMDGREMTDGSRTEIGDGKHQVRRLRRLTVRLSSSRKNRTFDGPKSSMAPSSPREKETEREIEAK